jgi:hypothetical protein
MRCATSLSSYHGCSYKWALLPVAVNFNLERTQQKRFASCDVGKLQQGVWVR